MLRVAIVGLLGFALAACSASQAEIDGARKDLENRGFTVTSVVDDGFGTVTINLDVNFGKGCVGKVRYDTDPEKILLTYLVGVPNSNDKQDVRVNNPTLDKLKTYSAFAKCFE